MDKSGGNSIYFPPAWCSGLCRNAMNEICVENCAIKRNCSAFDPKPHLKLSDMPRFPLKESNNMSKEERFTAVTIYLSKIVDHLQGNEDEPKVYLPVRTDIYDSQKSLLSATVGIKELLTNDQELAPEKEDE